MATVTSADVRAEVNAHIEAQRRVRDLITRAIQNAWTRLGSYDALDVSQFLAVAVPLIFAGQRQAVSLSDAYLARILGRPPLGLDAGAVIRGIRGATIPEDVYRRPFVTVWSDLQVGRPYVDAVRAGGARAAGSAALDVQMAQRAAMQQAQDADPRIFGFARVADADACVFCRLVDGAYVKRADAMALHTYCGCSLEPLTGPHPRAAKLPDGTPVSDLVPQDDVQGVAVREHGEYGPTLGDPAHAFKGPDDIP